MFYSIVIVCWCTILKCCSSVLCYCIVLVFYGTVLVCCCTALGFIVTKPKPDLTQWQFHACHFTVLPCVTAFFKVIILMSYCIVSLCSGIVLLYYCIVLLCNCTCGLLCSFLCHWTVLACHFNFLVSYHSCYFMMM